MLELLTALKSSSPSFDKVRGLLYWNCEKVVQNSPAPLVTDMDGEMLGIPWDLLPMDRYNTNSLSKIDISPVKSCNRFYNIFILS